MFSLTAFAFDSGAAPDQTTRIGVTADYTWTTMDQVNKQLNKGTKVTPLHSGITGMLEFDIVLVPFLMVGARGGYLYCLPASASYNYVLYNQTTTINTSLIPVEAGVSAITELPATPISITAGVYGGYGFAFSSFKNDISASGRTSAFTQPFSGGNFIGEVLAAINFKVSSAVSFNVNGGYRLAKIAQMLQSRDVNFNGIPGVSVPVGAKGDILKDYNNSDLAFDFSGYSIGIGLSRGF